MTERIKVNINGKEYNLTGDNKEAILFSADLIDKEIKKISKQGKIDNPETLSILAALNIAEMYYKILKEKGLEENYLFAELDKMTNFVTDLQNNITK